jgi:hypothetical protein
MVLLKKAISLLLKENIYLPEVLEQNQNLLRPIDNPVLMEVMKNFSTKPIGNLTGQRKKV